jgi:hypothetical protein
LTVVDVRFTPSKSVAFHKFTQEHLNEGVQILVGSKVVAVRKFGVPMPGERMMFPFSTPEEAQAVVDSLTKK